MENARFLNIRFTLMCAALLFFTSCYAENSIPTNVEVAKNEKSINAINRYIQKRHEAMLKINANFRAYAKAFVLNKPINQKLFETVLAYEAASLNGNTQQVVRDFTRSPKGAYLNDQDRLYIKRLLDQNSDHYKQLTNNVKLLVKEKLKKENYANFQDVKDNYFLMPKLVNEIKETDTDSLILFANIFYNKMVEKNCPHELIEALFGYSDNYIDLYDNENNKKLIFSALDDVINTIHYYGMDNFKTSHTKGNYELFIETEFAYGLHEHISVYLDRSGVYSAIGNSSLREFRENLRTSLQVVYEDKITMQQKLADKR